MQFGPQTAHAGFAAEAGDLLLQPRAVLAELGKAAVVDHGGARAAFHGEPDLLGDQRVADAEDDDVRRLRQVGEASDSRHG